MSFKATQDDFIAAIRDPALPCPQGVPEVRMAVYRELFFNNVSGFVANAFPVLKSLYRSDDWQALVREFFIHHDCQNPLFVGIAAEFLTFLQQRYSTECDPVFMLELAHYEWLELVVATAMDSDDRIAFTRLESDTGIWKRASLALASHARVAQYHFEVEKISADYRSEVPAASAQFFCLFRDSEDEVTFLKLNPLSAQVLAILDAEPGLDFEQLAQRLQALYSGYEVAVIRDGLASLLGQMAARGVVVKKLQ
ncbi:DUF2063 domain-containing protein [Shewanella sp.]|uniref:HvfC family RiPP maturation protein n=1 Tax=Shewanella sp. TaxID=50422 RepID=UPI0035637F40